MLRFIDSMKGTMKVLKIKVQTPVELIKLLEALTRMTSIEWLEITFPDFLKDLSQ
jgi:hypothetical protein